MSKEKIKLAESHAKDLLEYIDRRFSDIALPDDVLCAVFSMARDGLIKKQMAMPEDVQARAHMIAMGWLQEKECTAHEWAQIKVGSEYETRCVLCDKLLEDDDAS